MKRTVVLLALRAAAFMAAATFIVVNLRGYLFDRWGLSISPKLYGVMGLVFIWMVFWLSTRPLFREVMARDQFQRPRIAANRPRDSTAHVNTVHRYPLRIKFLLAIAGLFLVAVPYISVEPGKSVALVTYVSCFVVAGILFAIDFYICIYSVAVKYDGILIHGLVDRKIEFSDLVSTTIVKTKNGSQIVLSLKNGRKIRIGGMLTDFSQIVDALNAQAPH